jgi:hypothetical protein
MDDTDEYFKGGTWHRRPYFLWSAEWDHDHCQFCSAPFEVAGSQAALSRKGGAQSHGWASEDEYHWVCDSCFAELRELHGWRTRASMSADRANSTAEEADRVTAEIRRRRAKEGEHSSK